MEQQFGDSNKIEAFTVLLENEEESFIYQHYQNCYDAGNICVSPTKTMLPTSCNL